VRPVFLRSPAVTAIPLGRRSPPGSVPPTRRLREPRRRRPTWCCCAQRLPVSPNAGRSPGSGGCSEAACAAFGQLALPSRRLAPAPHRAPHLGTPHRLVSVAL